MKWIFICLMMLNVFYFSWHQFVEPRLTTSVEAEAVPQVSEQSKRTLRLVTEGRSPK